MAVDVLDANADTGKDPGEGLTDEQKRARGDIVDDDGGGDEAAKGKKDAADPAALAAVAGDDDDDEKKSKTVPHGRFNEVNEELRTEREARIRLEERNRVLEEQGAGKKAADPPVDLRALRKQANAKLMEGDEDAALALQEQIDAELKRQAKTEAKTEALNEFTTSQAKREMTDAAERVTTKYPFLDSNNAEERNADAIESVVVWRDHYIGKGMSPGRALEKAAEKIAPTFVPKKESADDKGGDVDDGKKRQQQAIARGATDANKQPAPPTGGKGNRTAKDADAAIDVEKMSEKEFKSLPKEEKSRLRGDTV